MTKGTGAPLSDPSEPLDFPRNFNRVSGPDANSCAGCHNSPFVGGNGDIVANVFVLGQRFDFATFDGNLTELKSTVDEGGMATTLQTMANFRATLGMFGAGYIEMLARQMTADLQALRDSLYPGQSVDLISKGVSFGVLARSEDGSWDTSSVEGIARPSTQSSDPSNPPSLIIRPFHQAGNVISLRQFSNNAFNHHHGVQSVERFGDTDVDQDGWSHEMTRADITAVTLFQAILPVPGRIIPRTKAIENAIWRGEQLFSSIGCANCHRPALPLTERNWIFSEPNPYNPPGNLQLGEVDSYSVNLNSKNLPQPRLKSHEGDLPPPALVVLTEDEDLPDSGRHQDVVYVPAYTDLKLHDITSGSMDPNAETLDMNSPAGSPEFFAGNRLFLTRKLWGVGNKPNYFHHGQFTTIREAVLAHAGEALTSRSNYEALSSSDQDNVIEFLKSMQVLPPGTKDLIVDQNGNKRIWPPKS